MTIQSVKANNRRRVFEIESQGRGALSFPYGKAEPPPTKADPIEEVFVDEELAFQGITYRLRSGQEGSVLGDQVLEYNRDPSYLRDLLVHRLTVDAKRLFKTSPIGVRELGRRLGTSPTQIYRLLDPTYYGKTIDSMVSLLQALDAEVSLVVR